MSLPSQDHETAQNCYTMAYFLLPRYVFGQTDRLLTRPLEAVSSYDRPEASAFLYGSRLIQQRGLIIECSSGEDDDTPSIKDALYHMAYALRQCADRYMLRLVYLLRLLLFDMGSGEFYLDDVCSELGRDMRRVTANVDGGFALFA